MALGIQDNLMKADRTAGAVAAPPNVQRGGGATKGGNPAGGWRSRVGETFAQTLNRSVVKTGGAGETAAAPAGAGSFGALLNKQQLVKTDGAENGPAEGESLVTYLNRKKAAADVNGRQVAGQTASGGAAVGAATKKAWHRTGTTATEKLNNQQDVDEAADAHAKAEKAAEGLISNALILPILKQVRRSSFGENSVFSGGNGEKAFGPEFDMQLSDRIAQSPRLGVRGYGAAARKRSPVTGEAATKMDIQGRVKDRCPWISWLPNF